MTAPVHLTRIVAIVAELSRRAGAENGAPTLADLAAEFDVSPAQIVEDIQALTLLDEDSDHTWLLSLNVWQQGEHLSASSKGPFQRPIRLAPDEALALGIALLDAPGGPEIATRLAAPGTDPAPPAVSTGAAAPAPGFAALASQSSAERRVVALQYVAAHETAPVAWTLEPHQVVEWHGRTYLIAWCRETRDWRHFRGDRIVEARILDERFAPREDFDPVEGADDLFRPAPDTVDDVRVRFTPAAARWARERWPEHELRPDGSVDVVFRSASPDWLVRRVLEFGLNAVVIEPEVYREAMRHAVARVYPAGRGGVR